MATPERIAEIVHRAVQGMGSDGLALAEVLSVSTNEELRAAAEFYSDKHGEEMKERIVKECTGMLSKKYGEWMEAICHFDRNEDGDDEAAEEIAEALYQAGAAKMMGVDEEVFQQHLANASLSRCAAVCKAYEGLHKNTLFADVERKFRGGLEDAIIARLTPPLQLYAANLTKACKGLGSDKQAIARIFGTMSLRELPEFVAGFEGGADALDELLDKETGGDLRAALAVMLAEKSPTGNNKYVNENEVDAGVVGDSFREEFLLSYDWQRAADVGRIIARDKPHHDVATNPPHERWHGAAFPLMPYVSSRGYD
ncbi:hypothetical protein T492DRAFT_12258 [Pavlovales sp. CCMP2436]|nr:hypothetical protein T492DRAFT_12258 [Pavlovales sp. CCMP2436]